MTRNARSTGQDHVVTPGRAGRRGEPHCPHCGSRRVGLVRPRAASRDGFIRAQLWRCEATACGREFWQFTDPILTRG